MSLLYNKASFYSICPLSRLLLLSHPPRILEVEPLEALLSKHEERREGLRERSDIPHGLVLRVTIEVFQHQLADFPQEYLPVRHLRYRHRERVRGY